MKNLFLILLIWAGVTSCRKKENLPSYEYKVAIPAHFPALPFPENNPITLEKIKLGKLLFEDKRLSKNGTISCVSCHFKEFAMTDTAKVSQGLNGFTKRNSVPLFNLAYHPYFFRDGGAPTLEIQVISPIEDHIEMDENILIVCEKLNNDPQLKKLSNEVFGTDFTPFVVSRSLSTFIRSLISGSAPYDNYLEGNENALSAQQKEGLALFKGKANCISCHSGFDFTDYSFQNNGTYASHSDKGRQIITNNPLDEGKFKVASLRNLSYTFPYMFDGGFETLEQVIEHYNNGGAGHWNQSDLIQPLGLTTDEKEALLAFLLSLNDANFVTK